MKHTSLKTLVIIGCLIAATCAAMAYVNRKQSFVHVPPSSHTATSKIVTLTGDLAQHKIYSGGDGAVALSLTLKADDVMRERTTPPRHVDMVIVLDRSGSMDGKKIRDARQAVQNLLSELSDQDRFAMVSYANGAQVHTPLQPVTDAAKPRLSSLVDTIMSGGGTNLGAGLQTGINTLLNAPGIGNSGKVVLISDGLANQGITDPGKLGNMAAVAVQKEFSISTVGVGSDFNEMLMTAIADRGTGAYHYLENPETFAGVFKKEFHDARTVAATGVTVGIPLPEGVSLIDAAGYPIHVGNHHAFFHPGDLLSGQTRKLFLKFRVPATEGKTTRINGINVQYRHQGKTYTATLAEPFQVACVKDPHEAFSSVDKRVWEQKVLQDDFNHLRQQVAADIKKGDEKEAIRRIDTYYHKQNAANAVVGSGEVAENLDRDLSDLRRTVKDTFSGAPVDIAEKQKKTAKALQFEGYRGRRVMK